MIIRPFIKRCCSAKCLAGLVAGLLILTAWGYTDNGTPLRLIQTIALKVQGRIDHMAVDLAGGRLFVAVLGNNSLEVIDLKVGKHLRSITGLNEPQGVLYLPESQKLLVTNGGDGSLRVFEATPWLSSIR
jgi:DNA-binding beta-propeller fold protein YncE